MPDAGWAVSRHRPTLARGGVTVSLRTIEQAMAPLQQCGQRLRLRLLLEGMDLKTLPWEYIYLPPAPDVLHPSGFLALNPDISIVRHEAIDVSEPRTPRGGNYRMIAALASPIDQDRLNLTADREAIQAAIEAARSIGVITPTWVEQATQVALESSFAGECDIFHFSGHGTFYDGDGYILLQKPDGRSDAYPADKLSLILKNAKTKVAILSACDTAMASSQSPWGGVAASLVISGLAAVVASQFRLLDRSAIVLTDHLYPSLMSGKPIDDGVSEARRKMFLQQAWVTGTGVLLCSICAPRTGSYSRPLPVRNFHTVDRVSDQHRCRRHLLAARLR
jgi:CHAT domain